MKYEATSMAVFRAETLRKGSDTTISLSAVYAHCSCGREGAAKEITTHLNGTLVADFIGSPPCDHWRSAP